MITHSALLADVAAERRGDLLAAAASYRSTTVTTRQTRSKRKRFWVWRRFARASRVDIRFSA